VFKFLAFSLASISSNPFSYFIESFDTLLKEQHIIESAKMYFPLYLCPRPRWTIIAPQFARTNAIAPQLVSVGFFSFNVGIYSL